MRRLAGTLMVALSGCLVPNPEYDGATTADAASRGEGGSTGATPTTGGAPTTSGAGSGSAGESTGGEVTTEPAATGEPTTGGATTGDVSTGTGSTGQPQPPLECAMSTEVKLDVVPLDTGVVPWTMGSPCPWGGQAGCEILNFGRTEFYRLVNDGVAGRNAALIKFPVELVVQDIEDWGYAAEDLLGVRLEFVVWEPLAQPATDIEFQIDLLDEVDSDWLDGDKLAAPALENDSSFLCKRIQSGCAPWLSPDGPLASASPLGVLAVKPEDQPTLDKDGSGSEYHMQVKSELLPAAAILTQIQAGFTPGFAVALKSVRNLAEGTIGLKLWEAPWDGPSLYVEMCDEWN